MSDGPNEASAPGRRLSRGVVERRGSSWWNRFPVEIVDAATGAISRRAMRMRLGSLRDLRSAAAAGEVLDRYLALQNAATLTAGPSISFREYLARFDKLRISLMRRSSQRVYRSILRTHIEPAFGGLRLTAIDASVVQQLVLTLHEKGRARATIKSVSNCALEILKHARDAGFATHLVKRGDIKLPSEAHAEREQRHFSEDEIRHILAASQGWERALYATLSDAALRISEALGLEARHVDLRRNVLLVRQQATNGEIMALKTKTSRRDIPLLPRLREILTEWLADKADGHLIFPNRNNRPHQAGDIRRRRLTPLLKSLNIAHGGCHAFRHSAPGRLDALGLSPGAIQKWMGHSTLAQTEKYLHRSTADLHEQLAAALQRSGATSAEIHKTRPDERSASAFQGSPESPRRVQGFQGIGEKPA